MISLIDIHISSASFARWFSRIVLAQKMNNWSLKQNLYPAFFCGILALILIGSADTLVLLLIAAVAKAFAQGMSQPAIQTEGLRMVEPARRGVASSTIYIGGDLGQAVGPILGGAVAQHVGYGMMYWICGIPLAVAWVYFAAVCAGRCGTKVMFR